MVMSGLLKTSEGKKDEVLYCSGKTLCLLANHIQTQKEVFKKARMRVGMADEETENWNKALSE